MPTAHFQLAFHYCAALVGQVNKIDALSGKLSSKKARALFYNADNSETAAIFSGLETVTIAPVVEVRTEEPAIDPFAAINERNMEMTTARNLAAASSDDRQILVHGPTKIGIKETVTLEELTPLVRQAAENALLRRPKLATRLGRK